MPTNSKISGLNVDRDPIIAMDMQSVRGAKQKSISSLVVGSVSGNNKKRSPKILRKNHSSIEAARTEVTKQSEGAKIREKRNHKEKKAHCSNQYTSEVTDQEAQNSSLRTGNKSKCTSDKPHRSRTRQGPQRQSIRRQSQVEHSHDHGVHNPDQGEQIKKSKISEEMSSGGGGVISGAEYSDVFDEESQYYPEESDIKYNDDKSNCRKN